MCRLGVSDGMGCPLGSFACGHDICVQAQCLALVLPKERKMSEKEKLANPFPMRIKRKIFPHEKEFEEIEDILRRKRSHEVPNEETGDESYEYLSCPNGKVFCLEANRCSDDCGGDKGQLDSQEFEEEYEDYNDDDDDDDPDSYVTCPSGTTFCLSEMKCSANCGGADTFIDKVEDDIDIELDDEPSVCPIGQVFCLQVMACVSNCGFFSEEEEDSLGGPELDITVTCPEGMVFCMTSSQCLPRETPCVDSEGSLEVFQEHLNKRKALYIK